MNKHLRLLASIISLGESTKSWVDITRTGTFTDPRYGTFEIKRDLLLSMVSNFHANIYGQKIFIDLNHQPTHGAAGEVVKLALEGDKLRAFVEWTALGIDAIKNKRMVYLSAEYNENFTDNEGGQSHGPTLLGAALTTRPVIKRLNPVQLAETSTDTPTFYHSTMITTLAMEAKNRMDKHLQKLLADLTSHGLSEAIATKLGDAYSKALGNSTDDDYAQTLAVSFIDTGKKLADALTHNPGTPITLSVEGGGLTADQVRTMLSEHEEAKRKSATKLAESMGERATKLAQHINAAEALDDGQKKTLCESASALITPDMSDDHIKALADMQLNHARELSVAQQLSGMGYAPSGTSRVTAGEDNTVKALQEQIDQRTGMTHEKPNPFVAKVLAQYDRTHARELAQEHKLLAGGQMGIADSALPAGYRRTVIREALSDLNILNLVNTMTDFEGGGTTVNIPYETRDATAVANDGIVFEGQGIPGASIRQENDIAYVNAMKIALKISNEVAFFSRNNRNIDWDAYARNVQSNSRVIRELVSRRIANQMQRASDSVGALAHTADLLTTQITGTVSTVKTTFYPIVRQHQIFDLKGTAIGSPSNPVTVTLAGAAIVPHDGSNTMPAGTYYRITSHNLGYIQFVNELGLPVAPAAGTVLSVAYSEATNVTKFNLDVPTGVAIEDHLVGLLRSVGARKAILSGDRYVATDEMFMLMSPILNDEITNARTFVESQARTGSSLSGKGDLTMIKGIEAFGTNAPAIDLGDERILMGQAGMMAYNIVKPFETGTPFESVNAQGQPTGEKVAYGEEYNAIHMPLPLRQRLTSVLAYSFAGR